MIILEPEDFVVLSYLTFQVVPTGGPASADIVDIDTRYFYLTKIRLT